MGVRPFCGFDGFKTNEGLVRIAEAQEGVDEEGRTFSSTAKQVIPSTAPELRAQAMVLSALTAMAAVFNPIQAPDKVSAYRDASGEGGRGQGAGKEREERGEETSRTWELSTRRDG